MEVVAQEYDAKIQHVPSQNYIPPVPIQMNVQYEVPKRYQMDAGV